MVVAVDTKILIELIVWLCRLFAIIWEACLPALVHLQSIKKTKSLTAYWEIFHMLSTPMISLQIYQVEPSLQTGLVPLNSHKLLCS